VRRAARSQSPLAAALLALIQLSLASRVLAAPDPKWTEPIDPFRVAGNLYYVGSRELASYLVTTAEGHLLINANLEASVPQIAANLEELGFKLSDVKVLLLSQAHFDHAAGSARVKELTGARYFVMDADVPVVESGGKADFHYPEDTYPPAKVDRVLHDGDAVKLGGTTLVAHLTPGHTRGCTTWTLKVKEGERTLDAVIVGGPWVNPGFRLVGKESYPGIAQDFERTFRTLKALPCDLFLGAHGSYFDLDAKRKRMGGAKNPFIEPEGCAQLAERAETRFREELERQRAN
jgi:metallo-beta-lactamase class B